MIALDKKGCIVPLKDAVMYTYLPTSYSIGLSFVVNANFITDAGRQQIAKDCTWNEFIFSQIPRLYLNWIAEYVALHYSDWYEVLPCKLCFGDELSSAYSQALSASESTLSSVMNKVEFWEHNRDISFNERQRKLLNMLFDGFNGKLTSSKWAKIVKCSSDTALNDITDLFAKGILQKTNEGGRSTNYILVDSNS